MRKIVLSQLSHTWLFDLDGTILLHNGHLNSGDVVLPGVQEFWRKIPSSDIIIILSARDEKYRPTTENFLKEKGLRFNNLIMSLPKGERLIFNDKKPKGLETAIAINVNRDDGLEDIFIDISQLI